MKHALGEDVLGRDLKLLVEHVLLNALTGANE